MSAISPLLQITHDYLHALDIQDHEATAKFLDDTGKFTHRFFPASAGGFGKESRNKEEYLENLRMFDGKIPGGFKIKIIDTVEAADTIVIHCNTNGTLFNGEVYSNEYVITFRFDENNMIVSLREFMDSAYVQKFTSVLLG